MLEMPALGRQHLRGAGAIRIDGQGEYLSRLVSQLADVAIGDADTAGYLELLDRALEDRRLTQLEADALARTATDWGLSVRQVERAHHSYFTNLVGAAKADAVITDLELTDLYLVASLIGMSQADADAFIERAKQIPPPVTVDPAATNLTGLSVCFTGALSGAIDGIQITRTTAQQLAIDAGLVVRDNVVKGLDLLVVADPDSQSGKAKRARQLGTRVMAEAVFWSSIGAVTD